MSSTSSTYHIPFPRAFLSVNTPVNKASTATSSAPAVTEQPAHGFLSNRPVAVPRHQSVSSVSSTSEAAVSAPSSPPVQAAESPVLAPKAFTPLQLNARSALPPASLGDMTPVARSAFLANR